jgi:hypothetical protein
MYLSCCVTATPSKLLSSPETPQFMPVATCKVREITRGGMATGKSRFFHPVVHHLPIEKPRIFPSLIPILG